SRLDMLSLINGEYQMKKDVLAQTNSELVLDGAPEFVYCYEINPDFYGIYVSTSGNGTVKIEPETFSWNKAYNISNEFINSQPANLKVDNIVAKSSGNAFVVADGNIYYYNKGVGIRYGAPVNRFKGVPFKASPFIGKGLFITESGIIYDTTNKRFVKVTKSKVSLMPTGTLFDYATGKDLLYMVGNSYNNGYGAETFAILNDPDDNKKYLARFNALMGTQSYYKEIIATDFDQATSYAVSPEFGYLFYAVGSKVYEYDASLRTTKLMIDKGTKEITLIKFQDFLSGLPGSEPLGKQLVVCSYDGSEGTMELYSVPPVNGQIKLETTYTGFGKIKSISYRER
ncbi:MAG: hypothetical protein ACWIPI_07000, partial [Polaribacter sp.]